MPHNNTSLIRSLFGNIDEIVRILDIDTLPEEDQLKIIDRFAEILFKRILLHIPDDHINEVKEALAGDPETFLQTLEQVIPDIETRIEEEIRNTAADFGIDETE